MDRHLKHLFISALSLLTYTVSCNTTWASAFQLWEQDGASVGNFHAGYAAIAEDASTAFYNPAGIARFKDQQLVLAGAGIATNFKYEGTVAVNTIEANTPRYTTAQGGNFALIPALHYVAPLSDRIGFGFSVDVPFGLKTNYGRNSIIEYAASTTGLTVVDISPSLSFALTDKAALGVGLDVQRADAQFVNYGGIGFPTASGEAKNTLDDTGYGMHAGALYSMSDASRVGLSYHSQVVHHLTGTSLFTGELADAFNDGSSVYSQAYTNLTMPAYTALSGYHDLSDRVAIMASAIYTQWNVLKTLTLHNATGIQNFEASPDLTVSLPLYYRNTWNVVVGANYRATDDIMIRSGLGYDQTPVQNRYRNVTLPDNNRIVVGLGGHYQSTKTIGLDVGWLHIFMPQASIYPPTLVAGDQQTTTVGVVNGGADVLSAQLTWNLT